MKLRVGLIGLGDAWEARHRGALRSLSDRFEIRAVCSEVAQRAELVAREFNVPYRIARIRNIDYSAAGILDKNFLGIDCIVNPAVEAGRSIVRAIVFQKR